MKIKLLFAFIGLFALVGILVFLAVDKTQEPIEPLFFTDEPRNWVRENPSTSDEKDVVVDTFVATRGKLKLEKQQQRYVIDENIISLIYQGSYKGQLFDSEFLPADFENKSDGLDLDEKRMLADELALMKITNAFDPNDGIINSFVLLKEEKGRFVLYIFVDEDWQEQVSFTNVLWGDNFRSLDNLNVEEFDFSIKEEGVFIHKVEYDLDWFMKSTVQGGLMVGEINKDSLERLIRGEKLDITYMMVR